MYISDFCEGGYISRQPAVSGLMKLLSLRYPISLGGSYEDIKPSEVITDINECDEKHEDLIRQAFCEGLTDKTVESLSFRPNEKLTYAEAISIVYRVLSKYGLPNISDEPKSSPSPSDGLDEESTMSWMREECESYYKKLYSSNTDEDQWKIDRLKTAEIIIEPGDNINTWSTPLELVKWQCVLNEALGLDYNEVITYTTLNNDQNLKYDIAAVSIFKLAFKINSFDCREASPDEINSARLAISHFDNAFDHSKFAQMYSSGLLYGICERSDFTPHAFVSRGEAMILVKRIVENIKN